MKVAALLALAALAAVQAQPHHHAHRHVPRAVDKRAPEPAVAAVYVPGPVETVVVYELNGKPISEEDVRQGIANGTLIWGEDGNLSTSASSIAIQTPAPTPDHAQAAEPNPQPNEAPAPVETSAVVVAPSSTPTPEPAQAPTTPSVPQVPSQQESDGPCTDCDKEFPQGKLDCSRFPDGYGAIPLGQEGLGGWSGIQEPRERGAAGFDDIWTAPVGSCKDGTCCEPGRFCSYGCPHPYMKSAFPKKQGATKQSVGGLYCNEQGNLELPDASIAKTLCKLGNDKCKVFIKNNLDDSVAICRTDYPEGTESMTIPLTIPKGETREIAVPFHSYWLWDNHGTSAQYYINKKGVSADAGCTWTDGSQDKGNWAPLNFGAGWDDINMNMGFFSLAQNKPTNPNARLDYDINFVGDAKDLINPCSYKSATGEFCGANQGCSTDVGCTVSIFEEM
ncbi:hypothetical protein BDV96DRAFT_481660 [Lophiotrema nucula]|uniref:Glycoside hydrolase family 132 protein n=1 Tax=Lophiotrema nucula TaxID=690887 RepID=A0A6A5ZTZ5_9PLEO|nr:hypothetical protein BDV96DRAFT_481660 [Lophiotrema nucula]